MSSHLVLVKLFLLDVSASILKSPTLQAATRGGKNLNMGLLVATIISSFSNVAMFLSNAQQVRRGSRVSPSGRLSPGDILEFGARLLVSCISSVAPLVIPKESIKDDADDYLQFLALLQVQLMAMCLMLLIAMEYDDRVEQDYVVRSDGAAKDEIIARMLKEAEDGVAVLKRMLESGTTDADGGRPITAIAGVTSINEYWNTVWVLSVKEYFTRSRC